MRRGGRIIRWLTICLLALTLAAWVDSHGYTQAVWCSRPTWAVSVLSKQGVVIVYRTGRVSRTRWIFRRQPTDNITWPLRHDELFNAHAFGFAYAFGKPISTGVAYGFAVPYWVPAVLLSVATWRAWRRPRPGPGLCPVCGYDLRASPERCPECGTLAGFRSG